MLPFSRQFLLVLATAVPSLAIAELPDRTLSLSHPGVKWILQSEMPGALDGHFQFMATTFLASSDQKEPSKTITLKTAEAGRAKAASIATQSTIDIKQIKGRNAEGHYIFVTDKSLVDKPSATNNWKHMRQGMLRTGAAFVTFTVFSNDENAPDALIAMRALETIEFTSV